MTAKAHENFPDGTVLANGERGTFAGVPIEAVAAHDMTPGQPWHPPEEANGYVVTLGGRRIFFSGVGECVPEIQALRDIHVAFLPMNLPLDRMRPRPVAECLKTFRPKVVYLYHYDNASARWFADPDQPRPDNAREIAATIRRCGTRSKASRSSCATATGIRAVGGARLTHSRNLISPSTVRRSRSPKMCCWMVWLNRLFTFMVVVMAPPCHFTPKLPFTMA